MRHLAVEQWSRGASWLHQRDALCKVLATLSYLLAVSFTCVSLLPLLFLLLLLGIWLARLPWSRILGRALLALSFTVTFALVSWLSGDSERAISLLAKSFLSTLSVVLLAATTALPRLVDALERLGMPRLLTLVLQLIFRYLFVIGGQAVSMRQAAQCRGGFLGAHGFRAAAGVLAVLFGRSTERAQRIHKAMVARGFQGSLPVPARARIQPADIFFVLATGLLAFAVPFLAR